MVSAAKKEADSLRTSGQAEAERALAVIKAEVDRMSKRRDAIVGQLAALKDVVSGFGNDDEDAQTTTTDTDPGSDGE